MDDKTRAQTVKFLESYEEQLNNEDVDSGLKTIEDVCLLEEVINSYSEAKSPSHEQRKERIKRLNASFYLYFLTECRLLRQGLCDPDDALALYHDLE
mmetsp:Transcript_9144/g.30486  ORF Transcript_9144/g.30486 Transcript_9144/m.30486 type:complete len:97 (+) Transcript_9144:2126-2416(+)